VRAGGDGGQTGLRQYGADLERRLLVRPVLFSIFGVSVYSYGFTLAVAFAVATLAAAREVRSYGIDPGHILDLGILSCVSSVVGSRLVFVLLNASYYINAPEQILRLTDGGLSFHGGFAAAILSGIAYCRMRGIDRWQMADIAAPYPALGYAIVRIGCFLRGCCYGVPTDVPWALPVSEFDDLPRHPTQLYSSVLSLLLFFYLRSRRNHSGFKGLLMFQYVALYSVMRFFVEFVRDGDRLPIGLTLAQVVSAGVAAVTFILIAVLSRRFREVGGAQIGSRAS
jgi:phosphatidylglycerol:prolipoprotein diacylglycerol transferase